MNSVTAYQMLHRSAHVRSGQRVLIHGAVVASNVVHASVDRSRDMKGRYGGPTALQALTVSACH